MIIKHYSRGFTMVETIIVLSIMSILVTIVALGSAPLVRTERFGSTVKKFANLIVEAQTKSYTVASGTCSSGTSTAPAGGTGCFWRGTVLEYSATSDYYFQKLLLGTDLSQYSFNNDPRFGITGRSDAIQYGSDELHVTKIELADSSGTYASIASNLSIAFLAPDGHAYVCNGDVSSCDPSVETFPYRSQGKVRFSFDNQQTKLKGIVIFDPVNGSITSTVE